MVIEILIIVGLIFLYKTWQKKTGKKLSLKALFRKISGKKEEPKQEEVKKATSEEDSEVFDLDGSVTGEKECKNIVCEQESVEAEQPKTFIPDENFNTGILHTIKNNFLLISSNSEYVVATLFGAGAAMVYFFVLFQVGLFPLIALPINIIIGLLWISWTLVPTGGFNPVGKWVTIDGKSYCFTPRPTVVKGGGGGALLIISVFKGVFCFPIYIVQIITGTIKSIISKDYRVSVNKIYKDSRTSVRKGWASVLTALCIFGGACGFNLALYGVQTLIYNPYSIKIENVNLVDEGRYYSLDFEFQPSILLGYVGIGVGGESGLKVVIESKNGYYEEQDYTFGYGGIGGIISALTLGKQEESFILNAEGLEKSGALNGEYKIYFVIYELGVSGWGGGGGTVKYPLGYKIRVK